MAMEMKGFSELAGDLTAMAEHLDTSTSGSSTGGRILRAAARPIHLQMKANASRNPQIISGKLNEALKIGKVKRRPEGGQRITIGAHRKDWDDGEYYVPYVEHGHGGPHPAPAHPYIRPAYDTREDEAYNIIRERLLRAILKAR